MVSRDNFTFSELENWLDEHRVTEIECLVPDLTGVARGKILPREKFTEDRGMRLPEAEVGNRRSGEPRISDPDSTKAQFRLSCPTRVQRNCRNLSGPKQTLHRPARCQAVEPCAGSRHSLSP